MMDEKTSRLKDKGLSKLERVKVLVFVVLSTSSVYENSLRIRQSNAIVESYVTIFIFKVNVGCRRLQRHSLESAIALDQSLIILDTRGLDLEYLSDT
ncbi:hypothetical protein Tco_0684228 [Tanacetum coccineum]